MRAKAKHNLVTIYGAIVIATILRLFRVPVSDILNIIFVGPLFDSFEPGYWADLFLALALIVLIRAAAREIPHRLLRRSVIYGSVLYVSQRFFNEFWVFSYTASFPALAYWDIVIIAGVLCYLLSLIIKCSEKDNISQSQSDGFIQDNEIVSWEEDRFQRKAVASEIARLIKKTNNRKSFALGILGEYGSGKTSFLNLINFELEGRLILKISFNPWSAGSPETIRREFFDLLAEKVADVDNGISSLLYSYGRKVANFDTRSRLLLNWIGFFRNSSPLQSSAEYDQINKMLCSIRQKIVITIDDLDRLHPAEILEVLKLIRNTANFSSVFYLVGYDKTYVQSAIKTLNEKGNLDYLDKIFQIEIPLPKHEPDDLVAKLQEHLKEILSEKHYSICESVMIPNDLYHRYEKAYIGILRQGRDVVRFVNGFKIIYNLIGDEVDVECLFLLELIKFRFPSIYDLIYSQSEMFLEENTTRSTYEQYFLPRMIKSNDSDKTSDEVSVFKTHIEQLGWLSAENISLLDGLFMKLFNGSLYHRPDPRNSISYPMYFDIYFRYRLSQKDLSDKDFNIAVNSGNMHEFMSYCANHDLHKQLMVRLMQENILDSRRHFEMSLHSIFSFGQTYIQKEGVSRFNYAALVDKIYNYQNSITDSLYKSDIKAYFDFIKYLFNAAKAPYLFENQVIYHLKKKGDRFVVPLNELTAYQLTYFTDMAESLHGLSKETLWLFWGAGEYHAQSSNWRFEPDLVTQMKIYLTTKNPKEFLKYSIQPSIHGVSQVYICQEVMDMFDHPTEYRKVIIDNTLLDALIKKEYLEFFDKLEAKDFKQPVDMEFKTELREYENARSR